MIRPRAHGQRLLPVNPLLVAATRLTAVARYLGLAEGESDGGEEESGEVPS